MHARRVTPPTRSRSLRALLTALAIAAMALSVVALVVRALPLSNILSLVLAVGAPYVPLAALAGLVLAASSRRVALSTIAAAVLVSAIAVQVPWYYLGRPAPAGAHTDIRVLSANLRKGRVDARSFVHLATEQADVITASEVTPENIHQFSEEGLDAAFPYSVLLPAPDAGGIALWSRFPLAPVTPTPHPHTTFAAARVEVPGAQFEPLMASVHVISPLAFDFSAFDAWRSGIAATEANLTNFADAAGPAAVIVAGDFNSTPDMRQFRDLLTDGYGDAVDQTGAGFAPTFPAGSWHPPLITIDHVLTRNASASSVKTVSIVGSDHRALLATVEVPLNPDTP